MSDLLKRFDGAASQQGKSMKGRGEGKKRREERGVETGETCTHRKK